jgi:hypothetical protein
MSWDQPSTAETEQNVGPAQVGAVIFMVLTLAVAACYLTIFLNPRVPFNPFPPLSVNLPTVTAVVLAAPTSTVPPTFTPPQGFPPTWTPTSTPTPTETFTPRPTSTPWPTSTPRPPTSTPKPLPPFSLVYGPIYVEQIMYPGAGGWWTGIAGEVYDRDARPVTEVTVRVWDDSGHTWETRPGDASRYSNAYGAAYGGQGTYAWWEQVLAASCQESVAVHVQVIRDGKQASEVVTAKTTGTCDKNLVIVHFRKNY